ncbi:unnamed protein product [Arctia plantaginis]|uniref:Uncharacterized protein n=1 Tax=Arctia plantaginis TaxID=874455 RepID=A0A8S0YUM2_ARCPL|nr:unnamed protein product [Arctia plantaginis]
MRSVITQYPVDRYMVESSKKYEIVNIIDDDLWNTEPALKPEDEIILRKLHEMLQSTADDLKLLSGELTKFHEPGVQVKTAPTPLDEEFNEKVHIEEIVNAKFHGYKIIDKPLHGPEYNVSPKDNIQKSNKNNANPHLNTAPIVKKPLTRNLGVTRTKVIQIDGNQDSTKSEKMNNSRIVNAPVAYSEYSFKYIEPKLNTPCKNFQVQVMPSINIRSELKEQKVLQLDILPENNKSEKSDMVTKNVAVVAAQHEEPPKPVLNTTITHEFNKTTESKQIIKPKVRKVSKLSPCESSVSNVSSDTQFKLKTQKRLLTNIVRSNLQKEITKKQSDKRSQANLNEWRKKLNIVYGPSSSRTKVKNKPKVSPKKKNTTQNASTKASSLNNAEYIPYSNLTIGGARASDIEREISKMPNKNNIPLSPILDKIIGSRENSFVEKNPGKHKNVDKLKVLTTSDENLLQEVIDIEKTVSETLSKNIKSTDSDPKLQPVLSDTDETEENESYVDDFEDEKSDNSGQSDPKMYSKHSSESSKRSDNANKNKDKVRDIKAGPSTSNINVHNLTYTKKPNLSLKTKVDIFEFVHPVVTQDSATQSIGTQRISPKETQTTPRSETNVQPIHNDLWPTIDPKGQVEKMFELEKEFIKKLIVEEYGDMLEKNIAKPSTSEEVNKNKVNVVASQKNTQTSPAHVKNVMTSPTRTKTRTTSPFTTITVDHHTSPLVFVTDGNDTKLETKLNEQDLDISVNLSSPRFSLRLPRNSQEGLSNVEGSIPRTSKKHERALSEARKSTIEAANAKKSNLNRSITSTSSVEADSSDLSSLGEVKLRRMIEKNIIRKISSDCESAFSLSSSNYTSDGQSGILPLRSEGEMSLGLIRKSSRHSRSEGEASFGML